MIFKSQLQLFDYITRDVKGASINRCSILKAMLDFAGAVVYLNCKVPPIATT